MSPIMPDDVAVVFATFPDAVRQRLLDVRNLIFRTAADLDVGPLEEALRWGEPAYLTSTSKSGSTIRLGLHKPSHGCAVFFNCQTSLVETFRAQFPDVFAFEKDRAILIDVSAPLPAAPLSICLGAALTYHRRP